MVKTRYLTLKFCKAIKIHIFIILNIKRAKIKLQYTTWSRKWTQVTDNWIWTLNYSIPRTNCDTLLEFDMSHFWQKILEETNKSELETNRVSISTGNPPNRNLDYDADTEDMDVIISKLAAYTGKKYLSFKQINL